MPDLLSITRRLTTGQRSTITGLDENFGVLGCSEPYARRLCYEKVNRPALVESRKGAEFAEFRLTAAGMTVRDYLVSGAVA